jgi:hypothetical protein
MSAHNLKAEIPGLEKHPIDHKVILELIQYNDKDHMMFANMPVTDLISKLKSST